MVNLAVRNLADKTSNSGILNLDKTDCYYLKYSR